MFDSLHKCSFYMIFYTCCKIISINFLVHENLQYKSDILYDTNHLEKSISVTFWILKGLKLAKPAVSFSPPL